MTAIPVFEHVKEITRPLRNRLRWPGLTGPFRPAAACAFAGMALRRLGFLFLVLAGTPMANAQLACTVTATPVNFGGVDALSAGTYDARATITVSCTGSNGANIAACVGLSAGARNGAGQRLIYDGSATLPVQLFEDQSLTTVWGHATSGQAPVLQRTGDGAMTAPVYARLYVSGRTVPGPYSANFTVWVPYGTVAGGFTSCSALAGTSGATASATSRNATQPASSSAAPKPSSAKR